MSRKGKKQKKQQQQQQAAHGAPDGALGASPPGAGAETDEDGDDDEEGDDAAPAPIGAPAPASDATPAAVPAAQTPAPEVIGTPVPLTVSSGDGKKAEPAAAGAVATSGTTGAPSPAGTPAPAAPVAEGWPKTLAAYLDEQLKLTTAYVYALIGAVVFCVYANSMRVPFLFDDAPVITRERLFHELSFTNAWRIVTEHKLRPIPNLINYINYHIQGTPAYQYGTGPWAGTYGPNWTYHLFNMAVHAVNGILLFLLLKALLSGVAARTTQRATAARRLAQKGGAAQAPSSDDPVAPLAEWIALGATLFWLVHPIQTMAVTYITQRYTLLGALGFFASLLCYVSLRRRMEAGTAWLQANVLTTWLLAAGIPVWWVFGCLCKENGVILPLVLPFFELFCFTRTAPPGNQSLLDDIFGEKNGRWAVSLVLMPFLVAALVYRSTQVGAGDMFPASAPTFPDRMSYFRTEWVVLLKYLRLFALPNDLTVEQAFPPLTWDNSVYAFEMLKALVGHALIAVLAGIWYVTNRKFLTLCVVWYYMMLLIESSFIPILDPMVEHRMYVPSAFLAAGLVYSLARGASSIWSYGADWTKDFATRFTGVLQGIQAPVATALAPYAQGVLERRQQIGVAIVGAWLSIIVLFGVGTHMRNYAWGTPEDSMRIWRDTVEKRPDCARAYSSLGMEMLYNGRWIDAVEPIEAALHLGPYHVEGWNNIGKAYLELGSGMPNHGVQADPRKSSIYPNPLLEWARETLSQGIRVNEVAPSPSVPLCWNNLGLTYMKMAERVAKVNEQEELRLYALASNALAEATNLDRGYDTAWINLGTSFVRRAEKTPRGSERRNLALQAVQAIKSSNAGKYYKHQLFTIAALNIALADKFAEHHAEAFQFLDLHHRKCLEDGVEDQRLAALPIFAEEGDRLCDALEPLTMAVAAQKEELKATVKPEDRKNLEASITDIATELNIATTLMKPQQAGQPSRALAAAEIFVREAELMKADPKVAAKYLKIAGKLTWYGYGKPERAQQLYDMAIDALPASDEQRTQYQNEKSVLFTRPQPR